MKKLLFQQLTDSGCTVLTDEKMAEHTSFRIGGAADLIIPNSVEQLAAAVRIMKKHEMPYHVLGKGSNLLVSDDGIEEPVIWISSEMSDVALLNDHCIEALGGARLSYVAEFAAKNSLTGMEFAYGIPGSIGGAVVMNAGAYGGEMARIVKKATVIDENGELMLLTNDALDFSYRHSSIRDGMVVASVEIELQHGDEEQIRSYMQELQKRRIDKQPLQYPSAGSVFKRPEGFFAGKLIEDAGLKGYQIGGAAVSEKHAGFIINKGDATCADVLDLIRFIQNTVKEQFGILLECEIRHIGRGA